MNISQVIRFRPNVNLPNVMGFSRSTVRLAIQGLEYLGRIVRKQGHDAFVADRLA